MSAPHAVPRSMSDMHLVARVGGERFAFPIGSVEEALDAPDVTPVPGTAAGLIGQLTIRDRTVSAFDAGWALGVQREGGAGAALVFRNGARRVALMVDDVEDLAQVEPSSVRAVPGGADTDGVLSGVWLAADGESVVSLVRVEALIARAIARDVPGNGSST